MPDETRIDRIETRLTKIEERETGRDVREAARDVRVEVAIAAMNRLSALVGSAGLLIFGAVLTFVLTGTGH